VGLRRRTLVRCAPAALILGLVLATLDGAHPAVAQDPGSVTTTSLPTTTTTTTAAAGLPLVGTEPEATNQTVVETAEPTETALFTESRKIMAIIAGLVCVALGLAWLTYRFWRNTKPSLDDPSPDQPSAEPPLDEPQVAMATGEVAIAEPPLADHHGVDSDWQPRTGELPRVETPTVGAVRPTDAVRRAALGVDAPSEVPIASDHG
jgi:hypothetical protein